MTTIDKLIYTDYYYFFSTIAICVRYGLAIGAKTSGMVLALMYIMYPIAYPTALLLDFFLGESHGTIYKKAG
jgi:CBS domain containing-hemolysin-like protein